MTTVGREWKEDACWKRISSEARPYSLRYGAEDVRRDQLGEELERVSEILARVLSGIPNNTSRTRAKKK